MTLIRQSVAGFCELESPFAGEIELEKSYIGLPYGGGKRVRGVLGKTIVIDICKRNGKVYTEIAGDFRKTR